MSSPGNWRKITVEDACDQVSVGIVVQPAQYYTDKNTGVRAFRSTNIGNGRVNDRDWVYISWEGHKKNKKSELKAGDVLVVRSGAPGTCCTVTREFAGSNCIDIVFARPKKNVLLPEYLCFFTNSDIGKRQIAATQGGLALKHFNVGAYKKMGLELPGIKEQACIISLLATWDAAIEKTERLIAVKEKHLRALRERCLQKPQHSKRIKLKVVTRESTARNGARLGRDSIMAVTKKVGMRPMKEETIAASIDRYKVVRPSAFAYNPMRLNIGSIAMSPFDANVLVSPDYVVFECEESKLLPGYLNHLRFSRHWMSYFESAGSGSVRVRIYYDDLAAFTFDLPPLGMQRRIVDLLDAAELEIDLLKKQAEAYRRQKRGLMQKLLTGAWRVRVGGGGTDEHGLSPTYTD